MYKVVVPEEKMHFGVTNCALNCCKCIKRVINLFIYPCHKIHYKIVFNIQGYVLVRSCNSRKHCNPHRYPF